MKIKKIKTGLAMLLLVAGTASITSCKKDDPVDPPAPEVTKFDVTFNTNGGSAIEAVKVDENGKVTKPKDPTKQGYLFKGWFTDANCTTEFDFNTPITANTTIYAKFVLGISYSINFNDHCDGSLLDETYSIKNVSILPGCSLAGDTTETIDDQSYKRIKTEGSAQVFGNVPKTRGVSVKLGGPGKIKVWLAASGTSDRTVKVTNDGKKVLFEEKKSNDTELFTIELSVTEAQTLYIYGTNGFNIYRIDSEWEVPTDKGELESIAVSNVGSNQFIVSDDFSTNGLEVTATYSSGYEEILMQGNGDNEYTVDSSNYDGTQSGYYPITVNFKGKTATYNAYVYEIEEYNADLYYMFKDSENIWGNGALRNVTTRQINFGDQETYDTSAFTFSITANVVNEKGKTKTKVFNLNESQYTLTCDGYNKDVEGKYTVQIETKYGNASFDTYVVKTAPVIKNNKVTVRVDKNYAGIVGQTNSNDEHMFTTLNTAIEYLTYSSTITDSVEKVIYVEAGEYYEKVDVDIPNVTLIGAGKDTTKITFDAANGLVDPRGYAFGTDGSSTFGVRSTATNFTAKNITFDSYYNTLERYNALRSETSGTQALAIMIQGDRASFYNCGFTGFQDTIEMQGAGRQYFYKCFVSGATDYIFGTNSSALFEECEILTITNGQSANGGYITAPKGLNKGGDLTKFGYIFNKCHFTNDGKTTINTTSLGRAWDNGANINFFNSTFESHVSTIAFDNASQGRRLAAGLNGDWTHDDTICREYGNDGAGAISADQFYKEKLTIDYVDKATADQMLNDFWGTYSMTCNDSRYNFTFEAWTKPIFE